MIRLRCRLSLEDCLKAQFVHIRPSPAFKFFAIFLLILGLIVFGGAALSSGSLSRTLIDFFPILLVILLYFLFVFVFVPLNTRQVFSQQKNLQSEYEVFIYPEVIEASSEHGTMRMHLSDFYKYRAEKDLVLLYQSQMLFIIFPRRCFASEVEFNTFISYLQANLGQSK